MSVAIDPSFFPIGFSVSVALLFVLPVALAYAHYAQGAPYRALLYGGAASSGLTVWFFSSWVVVVPWWLRLPITLLATVVTYLYLLDLAKRFPPRRW